MSKRQIATLPQKPENPWKGFKPRFKRGDKVYWINGNTLELGRYMNRVLAITNYRICRVRRAGFNWIIKDILADALAAEPLEAWTTHLERLRETLANKKLKV